MLTLRRATHATHAAGDHARHHAAVHGLHAILHQFGDLVRMRMSAAPGVSDP